jgi:hypothetical protein
MEAIKELTFEKACEIKGYKTEDCTITVPPMFPNRHAKAMEAITKIFIMVDAANQIANGGKEWTPDFSDDSWKWENWYKYMGGSSGFRAYGCAYWVSGSLVGSRLCFFSREVGVAMAENEHYMKVWNDFALYN